MQLTWCGERDSLADVGGRPAVSSHSPTDTERPPALALACRGASAGASPAAVGAANTLTFGSGGAVHADNTDVPGLLEALPVDPAGANAIVLGAGGAARAAVYALHSAGAAEVQVWNRTGRRAEVLAGELGGRPVDAPEHATLIVNCTSIGLSADDQPFKSLPLDADTLDVGSCVVDMVYRPGGTALLAEARRRGARLVTGM